MKRASRNFGTKSNETLRESSKRPLKNKLFMYEEFIQAFGEKF